MSMILVVEPDQSFAESIADALGLSGWNTVLVGDRTEAIARMAEQQPEAVIVDIGIPEAEELLAACAASRGGPGSIAMVAAPLAAAVSADDYQADAIVTKPFSDDQLRRAVEACALIRKQRRQPARPRDDSQPLSSADIFGDILKEVELERPKRRNPAPTSTEPASPAATVPAIPAPEATTSAAVSTTTGQTNPMPPASPKSSVPKPVAPKPVVSKPASDDLEERLQQTLSGLMEIPGQQTTVRPAAPTSNDDLDDLLDRTLGPLAQPQRRKRRTPAAPPASATPTPATPAPVAPESMVLPPEMLAADPTPTVDTDATAKDPADVQPDVQPTVALPTLESPPIDSAGTDAPETGAEIAPDPYRTQLLPTVKPTAEPDTDTPSLGDYTLEERIAVGGMAEVWKARRRGVEGFEKSVAIKRVLAHLTDSPELVSMLIDEAKLAARLSHPNIVQIFDLGKVEDDFFIAMELVDGTDLRSMLKSAQAGQVKVPIGVAMMITARVARALDYAHRLKGDDNLELGLVHRDVSPQNVLISEDGEIKLCDFGIAKAVTSVGRTQMGALKGKLQYMSPEQAWGKKLDGRSDIFSLGAVLFEMLTGTKLFLGDSEIGVLDAVRDCEVPALRSLAPNLPEEAERILLRALAKQPEDRYQSAGAFAVDLESLLASMPRQPSSGDVKELYSAIASASEPSTDGGDGTSAGAAGSTSGVVTPTSGASESAAMNASATGTADGVTDLDEEAAFEALAEDGEGGRGKGVWMAVAAVVLLALLAAVWWVLMMRADGDTQTRTAPSTRPATASTPAAPAAATQDVDDVATDPDAGVPGSTEPAAATPIANDPVDDAAAVQPSATPTQATDPAQPADVDPSVEAVGAEADADKPIEQMVADELARRSADIEAKMRAEYDAERQRIAEELVEAEERGRDAAEGEGAEEGGDAVSETQAEPPPPPPPGSGG